MKLSKFFQRSVEIGMEADIRDKKFFEKQFKKLPKSVQKIAARKLLLFEDKPLYPSLKVHKLKGPLSEFFAFSVSDSFRVMFRFLKNNEVIYYDIDTHDIYK